MDIYLNPKQKQKDHVPEEFHYESSSSSDDASSDEEELQPPKTEDEEPPQTQDRSDNRKKRKNKEKFSRIYFSPSKQTTPTGASRYSSITKPKAFNFTWPSEDSP